MGPLVATIVRLIVPLLILRWPLGGLIASVVADHARRCDNRGHSLGHV